MEEVPSSDGDDLGVLSALEHPSIKMRLTVSPINDNLLLDSFSQSDCGANANF